MFLMKDGNRELIIRYRETMNGCDKQCHECILYTEGECLHEFMKRYNQWLVKKKEKTWKYMQNYNPTDAKR